jgi:hypothetical protein
LDYGDADLVALFWFGCSGVGWGGGGLLLILLIEVAVIRTRTPTKQEDR